MRYTSQTEFYFNKLQEYRSIIPDNGTSVTIEFWSGIEWVEDPLSPITSPDAIRCSGVGIRLTPDVGGFFFDDGGV